MMKRLTRPRTAHTAGFTLLEVLITLSIISIGLLGLIPLVTTASRANSIARHYTEAHGLAQAKMERLKLGKSFAVPRGLTLANNTQTLIKDDEIIDVVNNSLDSGPSSSDNYDDGDCDANYYLGVSNDCDANDDGTGDFDYDTDGPGLNGSGMPGGIFSRYWNIVDDSPMPFMKSLRVAVTWQESGRTHEVSYTSMIGVKELQYY